LPATPIDMPLCYEPCDQLRQGPCNALVRVSAWTARHPARALLSKQADTRGPSWTCRGDRIELQIRLEMGAHGKRATVPVKVLSVETALFRDFLRHGYYRPARLALLSIVPVLSIAMIGEAGAATWLRGRPEVLRRDAGRGSFSFVL